MGKYGAVWMVNMSDKLMETAPAVDFASKFNESGMVFLAQRCSNKGGRYSAILLNMEKEGRKVGAVMVPEGKNGHGWQILNRVFLDVVSFFRSSSRAVKSQGSSGIRQGVTYAVAAMGPVEVTGEGGRSSVFIQKPGQSHKSKIEDSSRAIFACRRSTQTLPSSKFTSLLGSTEPALEGKCPVVLSERELASFNGAELSAQITGLRQEVARLVEMLSRQSRGGHSMRAFCCSVCGFKLKAQDDVGLSTKASLGFGIADGIEFGVSGSPKPNGNESPQPFDGHVGRPSPCETEAVVERVVEGTMRLTPTTSDELFLSPTKGSVLPELPGTADEACDTLVPDLEAPELEASSQLVGALVSSEPKVWASPEQFGGSDNLEVAGLSCVGADLCSLGQCGLVGDVGLAVSVKCGALVICCADCFDEGVMVEHGGSQLGVCHGSGSI
ncbi:hypothetical protein CJ030_MR1G020596 [Morella rubra]|uniref:Uncharacterized protein n=1 Tax=Morella rubra TaxID=262757 RepID=A0A6A1WM54_9ROSI|nr:hypothetical protein CJ030_MR1G020596 [Morella rubra]